jgi:hypothetical protein
MTKTLKQLAKDKGYEIRHYTTPLKAGEQFKKTISPFDFSNNNGGTINSISYYNNFYLYPINN